MKSVYRSLSLCLAALCIAVGGASAQKDVVVATVNGEPIYLSQLDKGIPSDSFEMNANQLRRVTLSRIIYYTERKQFLKKKTVTVSDKEVQEELARLERQPPLMGCPCHRFRSLNEFLQAGGVSREELLVILRNNLGLQKYFQSEWERRYPTPTAPICVRRRRRN